MKSNANGQIRKKQDLVANLQRELDAGWRFTDVFGPHGDHLVDWFMRYGVRSGFNVGSIVYTILAFFPERLWRLGLPGKIVGGILAFVETGFTLYYCILFIIWARNW